LVDTLGLLLVVVVHAADIQESEGAKLVLRRALGRFPRLRRIWADQGYKAHFVAWAKAVGGWAVEIVARPPGQQGFAARPPGQQGFAARPPGQQGFAVLPRRWVVERTFAWLGRSRRLSKDYEGLPATHEAWVQVAMIHLMLKRLAPP
jgi:putative transposase